MKEAMSISLWIVLYLGVFLRGAAAQNTLAISGATLLDVENQRSIPDGVVIVKGDKIHAVGEKGKIAIPADAETIDVTGKYIIPGLVDAHIHLFQSGGIYTRPDAIDLRKHRPYAEEQQWLKENAADLLKRYLACGITSVVDIGGPMANYPLRDSMNALDETAAIGQTHNFGSLTAGKNADLVVLHADPLESLDNWQKIDFVIHKGQRFIPDSLIGNSPADLVQRQLNGYNARNVEAFLAPYAADVKVYNFPDQFQYEGKESMRRNYGSFFEYATDLHCHLVNRIVLGNTVIDRELVTIKKGEPPLEAIAIYKIENGEIARVYFDRGQ